MPAKSKRASNYRSSTRTRQRAATRAAILDAAAMLFVEFGYASTTITKIAARADVSSETVYVIFGNKRDLLHAVIERAAAGPLDAVLDSTWLEQVRAEPNQRRRLALMADATRGVLRRVAPLDEVVRAVATTDPDIADLQRDHEMNRLRDVQMLVELLAEAGTLRVRVDEAAELMWALSRSTGLYRSLTVECGWSDERAFNALNDVLARVLLPDPSTE